MAEFEGKRWLHRMYLLICLLLFLGSAGCNRTKPFKGYEGSWWESTPLDQRLGFIDGFVDGYTYGCSKEAALCEMRSNLEKAISSYYLNHHEELSRRVGDVLISLATSSGNLSSGEDFSNAGQQREVFDGQVWMKYSPKKRLGFVEGWLNAVMPQTSRSAQFPRNPEHYSDAVTSYYGLAPAGSGESVIHKRIADVLWSMRNQGRARAGH